MTQTVISNCDLLSEDNTPSSTLADASCTEASSEAAWPERAASEQVTADKESADEASIRIVHGQGFAELSDTLGATLLVATFQVSKLVAFRAQEDREICLHQSI